MLARDIMQTQYHSIHPDIMVAAAVPRFQVASRMEGRRIFGLMVTDDQNRLVGMLSMYDILNFIRLNSPRPTLENQATERSLIQDVHLEALRSVPVGDLMTREVITVSTNTPLSVIMGMMIERHIRRIPVLQDQRVAGIVYISDLFYALLKKFLP